MTEPTPGADPADPTRTNGQAGTSFEPDLDGDTRTDLPTVDDDHTAIQPAVPADGSLFLSYAALSDVGRVRKDNQDSGYAGPWVLTVCDGVGGAARGDIASSTAVQALRKLDGNPGDGDPLGLVAGAIHRAHDRIAELVEEDPSLNGTSTTVTLALFDGTRIAIGHIGDSRAYLYRAGTLTQLTKDHTFVQSLIDEGRITEEESRTHPHRNLILKALDGIHDVEPDLFFVDLAPGDRLFLCSDGACGSLTDAEMGEILAEGTPDFAVVEMIRAALEAGSSDNVTAVVADVVTEAPSDALEPMLVGAAADLPRRNRGGVASRLLGGHRPGEPGEPPAPGPVPSEVPHAIRSDPIDPEVARYAPRPPRRFAWVRRIALLAILIGIAWLAVAAAYTWSQQQYYVADKDGKVTIFRGVDANLLGFDLGHAHEETDLSLDSLSNYDAQQVRDGIDVGSLEDARSTVDNLAKESGNNSTTTPSDTQSEAPGASTTDAGTDAGQGGDGQDSSDGEGVTQNGGPSSTGGSTADPNAWSPQAGRG